MLTESLISENSASLLLVYCKDIDEWPHRWAINHADISIGYAINEYFKCFLIDRIDKKRTKSTIKIYARYLWALGGELIRRIHDDNNKGRMVSKDLILKYIVTTQPTYGDFLPQPSQDNVRPYVQSLQRLQCHSLDSLQIPHGTQCQVSFS